jgi:sarcosine oxidase subunit beta
VTPCPYLWFARAGDERAATAIRERYPAIETDVEVSAVARDAGYLDPGSYVVAMADRARTAGVDVRTDTGVAVGEWSAESVEVAGGSGVESFETVLVAAGAHTERVLSAASHPVAMKPYRVQALVTDRLRQRV